MPKPDGNIGQNIVRKSKEAVVPASPSPLPHGDVQPPGNVTNDSYVFFDFVTHSFKLVTVSAQDNVCKGTMCDGQFGADACGCTKAPARKHWALNFVFTCDELDDIANDEVAMPSVQVVCREFFSMRASSNGQQRIQV